MDNIYRVTYNGNCTALVRHESEVRAVAVAIHNHKTQHPGIEFEFNDIQQIHPSRRLIETIES